MCLRSVPASERRPPALGSTRQCPARKQDDVPYFSLYELRHTFATRLSEGGVADHFVAQALRQDDSAVFKRYSQAKLEMLREALQRLDRGANERDATSEQLDPTDLLFEQS